MKAAVACWSPEALRHWLVRTLAIDSERRIRMGLAARQRIDDRFHLDKIAQRLLGDDDTKQGL